MCGICGYIGNENAYNFIYEGILSLLNRGYDSVGLCTIEKNQLLVHKHASRDNENAETKLLKYKSEHVGNIGIAHCRWRTNGENSDNNSHPHNDHYNLFSIVHNGIIDNYKALKTILISNQYEFKSETDTEVIVNLISYYFKIYSAKNDNNTDNKEIIIKSIKTALADLDGSYAIALLFKETPNAIYCAKRGAPLLIGMSTNNNFAMVSSEQYGFNSDIDKYLCLDDNDVVIIERNCKENKINLSPDISYKFNKLKISKTCETHEPFPNWTIKEINDQPETVLLSTIDKLKQTDETFYINMTELDQHKNELFKIDNLIILACGSSYNAGLISINYFKDLCNFSTIQIFDGSFFNETNIPKLGKTALLFVSQSGETKDLHEGIQIGKKLGLMMIGVINVINSMIARETQCQVYLNCGREIAVASTKAVTSQIIVLSLIAIWFSQNNVNSIENIENETKIKNYFKDLFLLPNQIREILNSQHTLCNVNEIFNERHNSFVISHNAGIAYEGALKIKEMAYIMTEGTFGSSLKHGSFSILDDNFPIIVINNKDSDGTLKHYNKLKNIIEEVKSRNASIITITDEDVEYNNPEMLTRAKREKIIKIPINKTYSSILSIIVLQLISYNLSLSRNNNIDFPRHLSKTVTV